MKTQLLAVLLSGSVAVIAEGGAPKVVDYAEPSKSAPHATVNGQGAISLSGAKCQVPGTTRLCDARLTLVDGKPTAFGSTAIRVEPGERFLGLMCTYWKGGPMFFGTLGVGAATVKLNLEAGRSYRVLSERTENGCIPSLVDKETGQRFGGSAPADLNKSESPTGAVGSDP